MGSDAQSAVDGDFVMREDELQPVLKALRRGGINIVAIHNHVEGESPRMVFLLEQDKQRADAVAAMQADAQGPHEAPIRAGEERILAWAPPAASGQYAARATLIYDLSRYNERSFTGDQAEIFRRSLPITVQQP